MNKNYREYLPKEFIERIDRFNKLFLESTKDSDNPHNFEEDELFGYELLCMNEAIKFIEIFRNEKTLSRIREEFDKTGSKSIYDFVKFLESKYNLRINKNDSENTICFSYELACVYIISPFLIPFLEGALSDLVGNEKYYDNRNY
jgi:hypothetical protein